MKKEAVIIDYGMGNLWSVKSALNFIGVETLVTSDPKKNCFSQNFDFTRSRCFSKGNDVTK